MLAVLAGLVIIAPMGATLSAAAAATPCTAPVVSPVACENSQPGSDPSQWDIGSGTADESIEGFATDTSVNVGGSIGFKIHTNATAYTLNIFRMGYYQGLGARFITSLTPSVPNSNSNDKTNCLSDTTTGLVDCGNWKESARWNVPSTTVSGVFMAILRRNDTGGVNEIPFVVRNDSSTSKIVAQASDTTWEAYNQFGGNSLYAGSPDYRAYKVSFNRPYRTRYEQPNGQDFFFGAEYPMVRFMEANGYDVSYISGVDSDRLGANIKNHQVFMSIGHDEYWSGNQRTNVEAARDAGVNLAFFSGNEVFWKTRYEPSIDGTNTANRTLVTYKETHANAKIDPSPTWTGTWRDSRFSPPADGGRPENSLTGQLFIVNCCDSTFTVPQADGQMRLWRNTSVASLAAGTSATLQSHTLGYEWDEDLDNGSRPAGEFYMSTSTNSVPEAFTDEGNNVAPATITHHLSLYRAASGALVFGAGTVQWSYGLDSEHDGPATTADVRMQQATVNLLADMGVQPTTLISGLVTATKSTDTTTPTVTITSPTANQAINNGAAITVKGTAADVGGKVGGVEVSVDGGATWHVATGRTSWTYSTFATGNGVTNIMARATDDSANTSAPVTVSTNSSCPCTIFGQSVPTSASISEPGASIELGTRFTASSNGFITGVRFYKASGNTGTHTGTLWTSDGQVLATGSFTGETSTGWQTLTFPQAVPINAGTTYVASYHTPNGVYNADPMTFEDHAYVRAPLTAVRDTDATPNGVYFYGNGFPTGSSSSSNYWVDPVFTTSATDTTPPTVTAQSPVAGASSVATTTTVTATFSEPVNPSVTFTLSTGSTAVAGSVLYDSASRKATFTPSAPLSAGTQYTASVRATDLSGNIMPSATTWTFKTASAQTGSCPCSIWNDSTVPAVAAANDTSSVELGTRFTSDVGGQITGVRFYKGATNTGTHTGTLWSISGTKLAQVTFTNETAQGWQQANFATPVTITAGTQYVISYHAPNGNYSVDDGGFTGRSADNPPLHAPASTAGALNGLYIYGASPAFPNASYHDSNYWVDVVFSPTTDTSVPTVIGQNPAPGQTGVPATSTVRAQFSKAVTPSSIVFTLKNGTTSVAGTVSYDTASNTATFTPSAALATNTTYTADVSGATDSGGRVMAGHVTWNFTTSGPGSCPCTVLGTTSTPAALADNDPNSVELGMRFTADVNGSITGIRFYKGTGNTGTHVGSLWSASGGLLARVTFTGETASGWQTAALSTPVAVTAGTQYIVSYHAPNGHYSVNQNAFSTAGIDNAPLHAPVSSPSALNGVYVYGASPAFPSSSWLASNYWVDVTFAPS
jgi:hypothetical protein